MPNEGIDAFAVLTEKLLKVPHAEIQKRIAGESGESQVLF
jgi:hypothetical protein